jgi:hypothetical protein
VVLPEVVVPGWDGGAMTCRFPISACQRHWLVLSSSTITSHWLISLREPLSIKVSSANVPSGSSKAEASNRQKLSFSLSIIVGMSADDNGKLSF